MTLQNVVPQLESELNVEDTDCRILATATISAMLASLNGGLILSHYSSAYKSWTSRRNDKSAQVRTTWIQGVGQILHSSSGAARLPEVEKICIDGLMTKFIDPDEKVRTAACFVVGQMPYAVAKECLTSAVLSQFAIRCRDKKHATQSIAFSTISRFLQAALPDIVAGNKHVRDKFGPLVNDMLHCMYINDPEVSAMLEEGLLDHVLNVGLDDGFAKAPQLLELVNLADEKARKALFVILGPKQMRNSQLLAKYLQVCDKFNGGIMDRNEDQITKVQTQIHRALAAQCPDTQTAVQDLLKFAMLNDRKLYKLMQSCLNIDSDDRLIRKAYGEFKSRMLKTPGHTATTMCMILRRSAFLILNRSLMPGIYAAAANPVSVYAAPARELLKVITSSHSSIYRAYLEPIIKDIKESGLVIAVDNLKAFAIFARSNTDIMPDDADFEESLQCIALKGSPVQVKQAVTILCSMKSRDTMAEALCTRIMAGLAYGEDHLLGHLAALAQLSLLAAQAIERWANDISAFCLKELLLKSRTGVDNAHADLEWVADNTLEDECRAKCLAIKILGNRLRAFHAAETATEIARPVFRALQSIIDNVGEVSLESNTPLHHRSRIRLEASRIMIKLAQFPIYERLISARDFNSFALFAQDLEYHVRTRFLTQLQKSLVSGKLPARFNVILFLAAHDPDKHLQDETLKWAKNLAISHRSQGYMMEAMLPRLVHLLAHHPDFAVDDRDDNDLLNFAVYFSFYFDAVVTEESLTLVYHYAQRLKQVADAVNHDSDVSTLQPKLELTIRTFMYYLTSPRLFLLQRLSTTAGP
jgi:sister-chromatid-cohesion protein PDS5